MQRTVQFRDAVPSDYPAICALITSADELYRVWPKGKYPLTVEQLETIAEQRKALTVALLDEQVIGFANFYQYEAKNSAFIGNVIIDQRRRNLGLGKQLIQHMIQKGFGEHQLKTLYISVFCDNTPALILYHQFGFEPYALEERLDHKQQRTALLHMKSERGATYA